MEKILVESYSHGRPNEIRGGDVLVERAYKGNS